MTINVGSVPGAAISGGSGGLARQSRPANRQQHGIMLAIGLAAVIGLPRNRGFQAGVITVAIGLAALAALARENQARSLARLAAWDKRRNLRYLHKVLAREA